MGVFKEPVAAVVVERNGRFDVAAMTGSAFLRDKNRGIFATAKHVVEKELEYKLYFCGKVYRATRELDGGITDVGFLIINDSFNPSDFPEPYPLAEDVKEKERAFIRGIHLHPEDLQKDKIIHQILDEYYDINLGTIFNNRYQEQEFVYDSLLAKVVKLDVILRNSSVRDRANDGLNNVIQLNFALKAEDDHKFSFGGLSGGPALNDRGEVIGINSNEDSREGRTVLEQDGQLHYYPRVTINLLPIQDLKRALARLNISSR